MNRSQTGGEFDYIIVGAGSAGCILANRLTADPATRVLLLEAGGEDRSIWLKIPFGYARTVGNPAYDWCFETAPEPELHGRKIMHPRGKTLGGSSSINGLFQVRGQAGDFDHWRQLGLEGWGWDVGAALFHEARRFRRRRQRISRRGRRTQRRAAAQLVACARCHQGSREAGRPARSATTSTPATTRASASITPSRAMACAPSTSRAFLRPVRSRANLKVETDALAQRILFDGRRAVGRRPISQGDRASRPRGRDAR